MKRTTVNIPVLKYKNNKDTGELIGSHTQIAHVHLFLLTKSIAPVVEICKCSIPYYFFFARNSLHSYQELTRAHRDSFIASG